MCGSSTKGGHTKIMMARVTAAGTIDSTYATNGYSISTNFMGSANDSPNAIVLDDPATGVAALAGGTQAAGSGEAFAAHVLANGALDTAFGPTSKGWSGANYTTSNDVSEAIAFAGGSYLLAGVTALGSVNSNFALARFQANGILDTTFGTGGQVTTDIDGGRDHAHAITLDGSGNLLVAGENDDGSATSGQVAIARYDGKGTLDGTFGTGGIVVFQPPSSTFSTARAVAVQTDGKIVVVGSAVVGGTSQLLVARFNP
jgi:uncharacterized delta-60 repeat protein